MDTFNAEEYVTKELEKFLQRYKGSVQKINDAIERQDYERVGELATECMRYKMHCDFAKTFEFSKINKIIDRLQCELMQSDCLAYEQLAKVAATAAKREAYHSQYQFCRRLIDDIKRHKKHST